MKKIIRKIKRFIIFTIGNNLSFLLQVSLTLIFTELLKIFYIISYSISLILATIALFFYNEYITFKIKRKNLILNLIKFTLLTTAIYIPNIISIYLITSLLNVLIKFQYNYILSIVIVSIPYAIIYYLLCKKWIFKISS